ncbi:MAG: bifunctional phosphoribosylaminoimidazolecarboxamide formyltransferase/IMP cyclohydrolase PurH [Planctomyces sp.]|nr:bifunctional phosphoribosylaminoimidazolecarboxamide formyltransferase/IMP cyclohydrolase PurH [Planctomyces sp.]
MTDPSQPRTPPGPPVPLATPSHQAPPAPDAPARPIARALLSVWDKAGLIPLAQALHAHGAQLVSTGGTATALRQAGLPVTQIEDLTGLPEMMDGRLKTLHPRVHGGILAVRDLPAHAAAMSAHGIAPIDLVCVNLYPFEATARTPGVAPHQLIEQIDIGGPAMIRSAAKNHAYVTVLTDPAQYSGVALELAQRGGVSAHTRARLAADAFARTAAYDAAIAQALPAVLRLGDEPDASPFPQRAVHAYTKLADCRYGENPHQRAAVYVDPAFAGPSVPTAAQLHGKALSYNNIQDAAAALDLVLRLGRWSGAHACAVIKHANPCGAAVAGSSLGAATAALAGDPLAAFGGIMACSHPIDAATAHRLTQRDVFVEVLLAPGFAPEALGALRARSSSIRLLAFGASATPTPASPAAPGPTLPAGADAPRPVLRPITGGALVQDADSAPPRPEHWQHQAGPLPTPELLRVGSFGEIAVSAMTSNAVCIVAADGDALRLVGAGLGQVDRLTACRIAIDKARAGGPAAGLGPWVAVSDAFFPFPDGPAVLIDGGARAIVQPGGSKRDGETFDLCAARSVTCLTTGVRRFRH